MRLVMLFTSGDGCTYHCDEVYPIEYESAEQALVDFETLCVAAAAEPDYWERNFVFAGRKFESRVFYEERQLFLPDFLTLDEWFARDAL